MSKLAARIAAAVLLAGGLALAIYLAQSRPGMFGNATYMAVLVFLQILVIGIWNFRRWFFVLMLVGFLWAGMDIPMAGPWNAGRWVVLGVGAVAGFVVYMAQPQHRYGAFHLIAGMGAITAFVSAMVSEAPTVSSMKALSLFLLFLYAACGGRAGIVGRERQFVAALVLGCEIAAFVTAVSYFVLGSEIWGNPNSLGAAMALVTPVLLWSCLTTEAGPARVRRALAFLLTVSLLIWSNSRASLFSSFIAMALLCLCLRKNRLLVQGLAVCLCLISVIAIVAPSRLSDFMSDSSEQLIYKGHREEGLMGSRRTPWQDTIHSVQQHPWFGTGFGTSMVEQSNSGIGLFASSEATTREHGNSYLAVLEWTGYLGVVPFYAMVLVLLWRISQAARWLNKTRIASHPAVPMMLILTAALVHASFEDWMFAVGFYLTVFFWTLAFSFMDFAPIPASAEAPVAVKAAPSVHTSFGMATPAR